MFKSFKLLVLRNFPRFSKWSYKQKRHFEDKEYWSIPFSASKSDDSPDLMRLDTRILIIVNPLGGGLDDFGPCTGNYFYEIVRSARERYGEQAVGLHVIDREVNWADECQSIAARQVRGNFSHILFHIEMNDHKSRLWRWDILGRELAKSGSGATAIGFMTDGTYQLHQLQCSRFQEIYSKSAFIQIDIVPDSKHFGVDNLFGPTFLPISLETISLLERSFATSVSKEIYDLSFIGRIYGYRARILRKLQASGIKISINPHKSGSSNAHPSYMEYMDALRRSKLTINFARANGTRQLQLKSRVIESAIAGTVVLTDDNGLSDLVLTDEPGVIRFTKPSDVLGILERVSKTPRLGQGPSSHSESILVVATGHFWMTLERGLRSSRLPFLIPNSKN